MALNIKNPEVEKLAADVARLAKETKTEAIRRALLERKERLRIRTTNYSRKDRLETFLRNRIWPQVPKNVLGTKISKAKEEQILGYGPQGV
jgi:antitoxin VapB